MAPASSKMEPTFWSSCSLEYLALAFEHGMDYCLRNKPTALFDGPVCGNGFVEQVREQQADFFFLIEIARGDCNYHA